MNNDQLLFDQELAWFEALYGPIEDVVFPLTSSQKVAVLSKAKRKEIVGPRRSGKTKLALRAAFEKAIHQPNTHVLFTTPFYEQLQYSVAFAYDCMFSDNASLSFLKRHAHIHRWGFGFEIKLSNESLIIGRIFSSDDPSMRGYRTSLCVFDNYVGDGAIVNQISSNEFLVTRCDTTHHDPMESWERVVLHSPW